MKRLQVLGTGCAKCQKLAEVADEAARGLNLDYELVKITDINQIAAFGIVSTPALAVDGKIKVAGKVPSKEEIEAMLRQV